jgi:hypothetical protein
MTGTEYKMTNRTNIITNWIILILGLCGFMLCSLTGLGFSYVFWGKKLAELSFAQCLILISITCFLFVIFELCMWQDLLYFQKRFKELLKLGPQTRLEKFLQRKLLQ